MSKTLSIRPSLEQLKKQAKELLKSHKSGDPDSIRRIQEKHPDWGNRSELELRATRLTLGDAQLVIAREYGCASWPKLKTQVESILAANKNPIVAPGSGVTWNKMYYRYRTSTDGKRKWLWVPFRRLRMAYQPPGLHRITEIDAQGQICRVTITDTVRGQELTCLPNQRKARLTEIAQMSSGTLRSEFAFITEIIKKENLQCVETRQTAAGPVDIFRIKELHSDVWIDQRTKRLVETHNPGSDVFNPGTDPACDNPAEIEWSDSDLVGVINYDIVFDVELDESLFRLEPPEGYVVESTPPFTEQDVIDYTRAHK